ncbi:MAG: putative baseplate assembly protein, partial [Myxococcota bacterium]
RVEQSNASGQLTLTADLQNAYDWRTVRILANVAAASDGETVNEVLGSGDGLLPNQRFTLAKPPLTYVPASNARGRDSTLEVRINGVRWQERDSLLDAGPDDEVYILRIQDDGTTEVTFGDGVRGARLPSGVENVSTKYRSGSGPDGEVDAGQLALLKTRPLGISEVVNPIPATGAAAPEMRDEARDKAPLTVLVLDRVVSIQDYEDFAKTFPGVGKAQAVSMWNGVAKFVYLTVGTESGDPIESGTPFFDSLRGALDTVRNRNQLLIMAGFEELRFGLCASVLIDERFLFEDIESRVHSRLADEFSYQRRAFGQDVTASELIAAIHRVDGVVAVDLNELETIENIHPCEILDESNESNATDRPGSEPPEGGTPDRPVPEPPATGEPGRPEPAPPSRLVTASTRSGDSAATQRLVALAARLQDGEPKPSQLLVIDPERIHLEQWT